MKELNKAIKLNIVGALCQEALDRFEIQIQIWKIKMPSTEKLVLDFGLGDFYKTGLIECWIANETDAGYCGKFLFVFEDQTCPLHKHAIKQETFYIVHGSVMMHYGDKQFVMSAGDTLSVGQNKFHSFTGNNGPALLLEISKPCFIQDNHFANSRIPIGGSRP